MEWTKLDLRKTSNLRKEVDNAITILTSDEEHKPALISSIKKQIDDLEMFMNDIADDERVTLFEAQRNRLRKALQQTPPPSNINKLSATLNKSSNKTTDNISSPVKVTETTLNLTQSAPTPNFFRLSQQAPKLYNENDLSLDGSQVFEGSVVSTPSGKFEEGVGGSSSKKDSVERKQSVTIIKENAPELQFKYDLSTVRGRKKALYEWEISTDKNKTRKPLQLDHGVFLPCSEFGLYTAETTQGKNEDEITKDTKYVDLQFVLTDEELMTLESRVRKAHAETLSRDRTKQSSQLNSYKQYDAPSMRTQAPYVDPDRNSSNTYRQLQKDKWVDKIGFRPTNPLKSIN